MNCIGTYCVKSKYENHGTKSTDGKEKERCRKCKSDEGRIETDMALSEFPAFLDNNARQPNSHVRMCHVKKRVPRLYRNIFIQSNRWNYLN